ncbi:diguanylate cyclase [Cytobacillus sp. FJAT-54145]|uniref:Diguanylate cyclase n=1 Tax=Cytobacillus spartinae TaxID=3299023 RepID=A0ABW6KH89_9BACI
MEKYRTLLFQKVKKQLIDWFEVETSEKIENKDVYLFLHSIKGTAGTIELVGLYQLATKLMETIESIEHKRWDREELRDFLYDLIGLSYEYEHFHVAEEKTEIVRKEDEALIQIIDDDVSMLILLKDALEEAGFMVIANTEAEKAAEQYFDLRPDCLVIDVHLPSKSGVQLLRDLQNHTRKKFIPTIMISSQNDRELRIKSYKNGADDFIPKPIDLEEFIVRVDRHIQRKKLFDHSNLIDELTQVYNRRFLKDSLERLLNEAKRSGIYFTLAILDLDHFKRINDTYGHIAGDRVLARFAQFLKNSIRSSDTVFRYGGEEFMILFPRTRDSEAKDILSRILKEFSLEKFKENDESFSVTFSAGVYMVDDSEIPANSIIKTADQALYEAKEKGRARVESANKLELGIAKKKLNVSVIDDDAIIRTMLMKILQSMEFEHIDLDIQVYEDGLKFFHSNRHEEKGQHFLILDGVMPIMDGTEVLQKVKQAKNAHQFHILMLTGRKNEYDIARALKLGADDYVTKPFSITELQARIQRLIQRMA